MNNEAWVCARFGRCMTPHIGGHSPNCERAQRIADEAEQRGRDAERARCLRVAVDAKDNAYNADEWAIANRIAEKIKEGK